MSSRLRTIAALATSTAMLLPLAAAHAEPTVADQSATQLTDLDDHSGDERYAEFYNQTVTWKGELCEGHSYPRPGRTYECAVVKAPLDWDNPEKGSINVGIGRVLEYGDWSEGSKHRLLISNPGGPGGNGLNFGAVIHNYMGATDTHNGIGIDPRGVGLSTNLLCPKGPEEAPGTAWADGDKTSFTYDEIMAGNDYIARDHQACLNNQDGLAKYINTYQTARDFNFVRALLGYETADIYGVSYGTWLGSTMEKMFPNRFDRVLLDGNMNWQSGSMRTGFALQAQAFQQANDKQLLPFLGRHNDVFGLGTSTYAVDYSIKRLRHHVAKGAFGEDVTPDLFDRTQAMSLYSQFSFTKFGTLLSDMVAFLDGDATKLEAIRTQILATGESSDTSRSVFQTIPCADTENNHNEDQVYRQNEANARNLPLIAPDFVMEYCKGWTPAPAMSKELFDRPMSQAFMMQNEGDPATGYLGALDSRLRVKGDVKLLTVDDLPGHGLPFFDSECAMEHMQNYLLKGIMPSGDVHCQAAPIKSGDVADTKVYEFGRPASDASPRPRPAAYLMRSLQEPVVDQAATDKFAKPVAAESRAVVADNAPEDSVMVELRSSIDVAPPAAR